MKPLSLILASKSPARLQTLRAAGIEPEVVVSDVDEEAILAHVRGGAGAKVLALATAKARAVFAAVSSEQGPQDQQADLILGCDSMFEFEGQVVGKPHTPEIARERLRAMRGRSGVLHTGHCLLQGRTGATLGAVSHATVHMADMSDNEIEAYIAAGEPLWVAGSFTIDGLGGPFIERVDGDHHGVVGLSLPLLRAMLENRGLSITQLWSSQLNPRAIPAAGELDPVAREYLSSSRVFHPKHDADGFILCSCGRRHWGLAGAAGVCTFRDRGGRREVLLQLRAAWSHGGGTWSIPGGAIEWNEDTRTGGLREFAEETGIEDLEVVCEHVADHGDWSFTSYVARCMDGIDPVRDAESEELRWVGVDELPDVLHPAFASSWPEIKAMVLDAHT
ncbi:Maf family nucleotide pyrophosphatase [Actinomycetaceae bacterium L2_0104]